MKTKHLFLFVALALIFSPIFAVADIGSAVSYLRAQPQDAWTTQALAAAGADNIATGHLAGVSGTSATDYAKAILALAAVGENPATFGNIDYVAKLKTYYNNNQIGNEGLLNDDMWSVLALASAGEKNSEEAVGAKNYLLNNQNADGGWGYAVGGDSDTNDTAAAIMALVEAGLNPVDEAIVNAVNYLKSAQNNDGGFGYMPGSESDSGSDSWIISAIYKIKQNPNDWNKNGGNPIAHLQTLQDADGGFWWLPPGTSEWNNKAMTAYAVIALAGKSFPVGYYNKANTGKYHIRIEGGANTICDAYADGETALDVVKNAAESCGYTYVIQDTPYGPYLSKINNEEAAGMSGWMYFVNYKSPPVGAADYLLSEGDEVLWYYGDWGWQPTRMSAGEYNLETGRSITVTVEYFNGQSWLALEGATVKGAEQDYATGASGQVTAVLPDGYYILYARKDGFIRSNKEEISVGAAVSQSIGLSVEIEQPGSSDGVGVAGEAIIFEVTPSRLNFGKIKPGGAASQILNISNLGTVNLTVAAATAGDSVFKENLQLDNRLWPNYSAVLASDESKDVEASLPVPANYLDSGVKTGELILWARIQE